MLPRPPLRYVIPNLLTAASSLCGFLMLWLVLDGSGPSRFYHAAMLLPVACLLDGFDGRVARLVGGESEFGRIFDSLSDSLTFGLVPALMAYQWSLHSLGFGGFLLAFLYVMAVMVRLSRFTAKDEGAGVFFEGLPAPAGGVGVVVVIGLQAGWLAHPTSPELATLWYASYMVLISVLMVSELPFRSFKYVGRSATDSVLLMTLIVSLVVMSVVVDPIVGVSTVFLGYLSISLIGAMSGWLHPVSAETKDWMELVEDSEISEMGVGDPGH